MIEKTQKITDFISSKWFFGATVALFSGQTVWLAITSRFPMAFDEAYHLGVIQFFSHRWNPLITSQPSSSYNLGPIVHGTSWLYHYLMSFPYRLMEIFTHDLVILVIDLRLINVALMIANLFLLRKLLRLLGVSKGLTNMVLFIFALTPIVTVLSAQINYDNLMIPLVTLSVYETVLLMRELDRKYFNVVRFLCLLCLCLLSSLVKFAFLPIFLAIAMVVIGKLIKRRCGLRSLLPRITADLKRTNVAIKIALLTVTALGIFLFGWVYGVNIARYHNPVPACDRVLNDQDCSRYYSWFFKHTFQEYTVAHPGSAINLNAGSFTSYWMLSMSEKLYGSITPLDGVYSLSIPLYSLAFLFFIAALGATVLNFKKIIRDYPEMTLLIVVSITYLAFLWARNYEDYRQVGMVMAINGRYLVPILAFLYVVLGLGMSYALNRDRGSRFVKTAIAVIFICIFIGFGGFCQYVTRITPRYGRLNDNDSFTLQSIDP
ncbi:MAG TPA: hypothetical protein VHA05_03725 [Candidatus Saccharimonadales bacterium]|nr:hypothetical protein [Candidatus Saccharimonadales bacterium]